MTPDSRFAELAALVESSGAPQRKEARHIIAATAVAFGFTPEDLKRHTSRPAYVHARYVAMYLVRKYCHDRAGRPLSYPLIARMFGGLHHSTVIHGCRKMARLAGKEQATMGQIMHRESLLNITDVRQQIAEVRRQLDTLATIVERYWNESRRQAANVA